MSSLSTWLDAESNRIFPSKAAERIRNFEQIMSNPKHRKKVKRKNASARRKKDKECEKKWSKENGTSLEEKSIKEIGWHKEDKKKEKASILCTGAKGWHKENIIRTGQAMDYEK